MRRIRTLHLYLGLFFTPAILFFAVSGAFQSLELHEAKKGADYQPPRWVELFAQIHKHQNADLKPKQSPPPAAAAKSERPTQAAPDGPPGNSAPRQPRPEPWPLRVYFALVSIGLITTSLAGVYMAFKYNRDRRAIWALLVGGTALPVLLLFWKV